MTPPFRIVAGAHNVPLVQAVTNAVLREASFKEPHTYSVKSCLKL